MLLEYTQVAKCNPKHRITGWLKWEGTSGDHLVQCPTQIWVSYSSLLRAVPS